MSVRSCRRCGRLVTWVLTEHGSWLALEPDYNVERGNVVLDGRTNRARTFADADAADGFMFAHDGDGPYLPHVAVCSAVAADRRRELEPKQLGLGDAA